MQCCIVCVCLCESLYLGTLVTRITTLFYHKKLKEELGDTVLGETRERGAGLL